LVCLTHILTNESEDSIMLSWALFFLVVAVIAGVFGFGGIAGTAAGIAQLLFLVFLVMFIAALLFGRAILR